MPLVARQSRGATRSLSLELLTTVPAPDTSANMPAANDDPARPWLAGMQAEWRNADLPALALAASPNQAAIALACWGGECLVVPLQRTIVPRSLPAGTRWRTHAGPGPPRQGVGGC